MPRIVSMVGVLCAVLAAPVAAEARRQVAIDLSAAWVGFADDGVVSETLVGGAARWHLSPKVSIGPELVYIQGENHSHFVITGNVTFDFNPDGPVEPFVVIGGGMFQTHETFFDDAVTSTEGAFTAGGGIRGRLSERVSIGFDVRVGWETHIRAGGVVSIRLGR